MNTIASFLRSLLLASAFSFAAPILLVSGAIASLSLLSYIPSLRLISQMGLAQINSFLITFGSGQPLEGVLVIGTVCGLVGALFDTYVFCQRQVLRRDW
jgi:hypothetical protein